MTKGIASGGTFPIGVTEVEYCYTSASGYTVCCNFNVTVEDDEAPKITCPADITTLTCLQPLPDPMTASEMINAGLLTDNCGITSLESSDYDNDLTHCTYDGIRTIVRTYTAWDAAGNSATCEQTFKYQEDVTPPVLAVTPIDLTVDCADDVAPAPVQSATDNCGTVNIDFSEEIEPGDCENQFVVVRKWVATDLCGNTAEWEYTIRVHDDEAPTLLVTPLDLQVDCFDDVPGAPIQFAEDNCDVVFVDFSESVEPGPCLNQTVISRRWVATDLCGNTTDWWQHITVHDDEPPVLLTKPIDLQVDCSADVPDAPVGLATDNCDVVFVDFSEDIQPGGCENQYVVVRRWTATDLCGNTDEHWQYITVHDDEAPVLLTTPLDLQVDCSDEVPDAPVGKATDNCGIVFVDFSEDIQPGGCQNQYVVVRRWMATDLCGNTDEHWQFITVHDDEPPVLLTTPLDQTYECADDVPEAPVGKATDNCDIVFVDFSESEIPGDCPNQYVIVRRWEATDLCGNTDEHWQYITVFDNEAPVWDLPHPGNPTVECSEDVPDVIPQTATDNCDQPVFIDFSEVTEPGTCPNQYVVVRTWIAQDDCGNATTRVQTITVEDNEAPVLAGLPAATVDVECSEDVPAVPTVTATDNCDDPIVLDFSEVEIPGTCPNQYVITRTWSAQDDCGNATSFVQTITDSRRRSAGLGSSRSCFTS